MKAEQEKNIFDKLNDLKLLVQDKLLLNQNMLKLIYYDDGNPLDNDDIVDPTSLVEDRIYFYPIIPDKTITEQKTYLLTSFSINNYVNLDNFAKMDFSFIVVVHKQLRDLDDGTIRAMDILSSVADMFNRAEGDWVGEAKMISCREITTRKDYYGIECIYRVSQFNRKTGV